MRLLFQRHPYLQFASSSSQAWFLKVILMKSLTREILQDIEVLCMYGKQIEENQERRRTVKINEIKGRLSQIK